MFGNIKSLTNSLAYLKDVYNPKIFRSAVSPSEDTEARLAKGE